MAMPPIDPTGGILTGAGSILGALPALFGSSRTTTQRSSLDFRPEDLARMEAGAGQYQGGVADLLKQLQGFQSQLQGGMPTAPQQFQFTGAADPVTRALAAQGEQDLLARAAGARSQIMRQSQGRPDVAGPLAAMLGMQTQLQQNPLMGQAMQQQFARQLSQGQMQQQQYNDLVRNLMGSTQLGANLAATGLGAQANLSQFLTDLATRKATTTAQTTEKKGGIFG